MRPLALRAALPPWCIIAAMSWRSIRHAVSVAFLLFVAADLTVPGFCQTDEVPSAVGSRDTAMPGAAFWQPASASAASPVETAALDDCFCCCVHVRPEPFSYFAAMLTYVDNVAGIVTDQSQSDPRSPTRPPRFF